MKKSLRYCLRTGFLRLPPTEEHPDGVIYEAFFLWDIIQESFVYGENGIIRRDVVPEIPHVTAKKFLSKYKDYKRIEMGSTGTKMASLICDIMNKEDDKYKQTIEYYILS